MVYSVVSRPDPGTGQGSLADLAAQKQQAGWQKQIDQSTYGRATELQNDPYQKSVMDFLQGQVNGANVPYTDTVKNSILAQQGQGAAAAEQAQMQSLRESLGASGGSIYDPGYQAAQREAQSQRQGMDLNAQGQLESHAAMDNFNAQSHGADQLAAARNAQNAQINQMKMAGAQATQQRATQVPTTPTARRPMGPLAPEGPKMDWGNSTGLYH